MKVVASCWEAVSSVQPCVVPCTQHVSPVFLLFCSAQIVKLENSFDALASSTVLVL